MIRLFPSVQVLGVTILSSSELREDLLDLTMGHLEGSSDLVEILCVRNQIPEHILLKLLRHSNAEVASAAALGEWSADPVGVVRPSLYEEWRRVIVSGRGKGYASEDYALGEIFARDPTLVV